MRGGKIPTVPTVTSDPEWEGLKEDCKGSHFLKMQLTVTCFWVCVPSKFLCTLAAVTEEEQVFEVGILFAEPPLSKLSFAALGLQESLLC